MTFIGITYIPVRISWEGVLSGAEMTQKHLPYQVRKGYSSQSWEHVAHCSACRWLHGLYSVLPKKLSQSEPSPENPACVQVSLSDPYGLGREGGT